MRKLFLALLVGTMATATSAVTVERIGAVIDGQVITVSEVSQFVEIRFFPRTAESEDEHRRERESRGRTADQSDKENEDGGDEHQFQCYRQKFDDVVHHRRARHR